jgi:GDP-L-fucose synthase
MCLKSLGDGEMKNLENKKIVITGAGGFLGKNLFMRLEGELPESAKLIGIDKDHVDLRRQDKVFDWFETNEPDVVIHLGADVGGIGYNKKNPGKLFYNNMIMGLNVVEACRRVSVDKLVVAGTVCGYPKYTKVPFKEENLWDGYPEETNAPYGVAKRGLLLLMQGYRKQYGVNGIYLLIVNMYGEHDHFEGEDNHVIPALIRKFFDAIDDDKPEVVIWGSGKATREFLYVGDACEAIIRATKQYDKPMPINVGAGFEISIQELVELIKEITGYTGVIKFDKTKPDGQPRRCLDIEKAERHFQFRAHTDIETGLIKTIDWYKGVRYG